jgi:hypothetical protein
MAISGVVLAVGGCGWFADEPVTASSAELGVSVTTDRSHLGDDGGFRISKHPGGLDTGFAPPVGVNIASIETLGGKLTGPADISFDVPQGVDPDRLTVHTFDEALKRPVVMGGKLSGDKRTISVRTRHLSPWWLSDYDFDPGTGLPYPPTSDFLGDLVRSMTGTAKKDTCNAYAITVQIDGDVPDGVDACARYVDGKLQLVLANSFGAPLALAPGAGLEAVSVEPQNESLFTSIAQIVRKANGDTTVIVASGQTATFDIDPSKVTDGRVNILAQVDLGAALLDFSGAVLNVLLPGLKDEVFSVQEWAIKTAKQVTCLFSEGQKLHELKKQGTDQDEMTRAFFVSLDHCSAQIIETIKAILANPPAATAAYYGDIAFNQLERHTVRRLRVWLQALGESGKLVRQPLTALFSDVQAFAVRLGITDPAPERMKETMPLRFDQEDLEYRQKPTAVFREPAAPYAKTPFNFTGWEPLPGDSCLYRSGSPGPWDQTQADAVRSGAGYYQLDAGTAKVNLQTTLRWMPDAFRGTIKQQVSQLRAITGCPGVTPVQTGNDTITVLELTDSPASTWVLYAYDERGYLLTMSLTTTVAPADRATIHTALIEAYTHWAKRVDSMVGTRYQK